MDKYNYNFSYMVTTNRASISSGTLHTKMGFRKKEIPISSLRHLYVKHNDTASIEELILLYEEESGKRKVFRLYSNEDEKDFLALVDELVKLRPDTDIRNMDEKEAFKLLGAVDSERAAFIAVPIIIVAVMGLLMSPFICHGLDSGHESVAMSKLASGYAPGSRNITITDARAMPRYSIKTETRKGRTTTKLFIALVPINARGNKPIHIIMETPNLHKSQVNRLMGYTSFKGVLRNILWEGIPGDTEEFYKEKIGYNLSDDAMLLEYQADSKTDLMISIFVLSVTFIIMVIIGIVLWVMRFRKKG